MSQEAARRAIMTVVQKIRDEHTEYPLVVETGNLKTADQVLQDAPYLQVRIDYLPGGGQMDLGERPTVKQVGQLCLYAVVKEGAGEARARTLLDFVTPYFDMEQIGAVTTHAVEATTKVTRDGLVYFPALVDFYYLRRK